MRRNGLTLLAFLLCSMLLTPASLGQVIFDIHEPVSSIDITTDGKKLAISGRTLAFVYDIDSKMIERVFDRNGFRSEVLHAIKFAPIPGTVFIGNRTHELEYKNYVTGMRADYVPSNFANLPMGLARNIHTMVSILYDDALVITKSTPPFNNYNSFMHPTLRDPICADISPNGKRIVAGYLNSQVLLWDANPNVGTVTKPTMTITLHKNTVYAVKFNPANPNQFLSAAWSQTARLWDATTGKNIMVYNPRSGGMRAAAFSPDGRLIATGGADRKVRLWHTASGKHLREFIGHTDLVSSLMFTPDGGHVVSGSFDGTVRFWPIDNAVSAQAWAGYAPSAADYVENP